MTSDVAPLMIKKQVSEGAERADAQVDHRTLSKYKTRTKESGRRHVSK